MHTYTGNTVPNTYDEVKELLYKIYPSSFLIWMIEDLKSGKVIGMMRISHPTYYDGKVVAGDSQRLHSTYWRKGYMKEARKLIYDYVCNELNVDIIYADCWEGNINSYKTLESVGYELFDTKEKYF